MRADGPYKFQTLNRRNLNYFKLSLKVEVAPSTRRPTTRRDAAAVCAVEAPERVNQIQRASCAECSARDSSWLGETATWWTR